MNVPCTCVEGRGISANCPLHAGGFKVSASGYAPSRSVSRAGYRFTRNVDPVEEVTAIAKDIMSVQNQGLGSVGEDTAGAIVTAITAAAQIATDYYLKKEALKTQEDIEKMRADIERQKIAAQQQTPGAPVTSSMFGLPNWLVPVGIGVIGLAYIFKKGLKR